MPQQRESERDRRNDEWEPEPLQLPVGLPPGKQSPPPPARQIDESTDERKPGSTVIVIDLA